jgi:carboxyl-terminal processing protease
MVMSTIAGGPAALAGILPGNGIVRVNGEYVKGQSGDVVAAKCKGEVGEKVELDFLRKDDFDVNVAGTIQHLTLTRARMDANRIEASTFLSNGGKRVGLLKVPSFSMETACQVVNERRAFDGGGVVAVDVIVIDIRGNVGGYMLAGVDTAKLFLPANERIVSEVGRSGTKTYASDGIGAETLVPVYLLVDTRTASAAEIFAAALQDNGRALVVCMTNTWR